VADGRMDVSSLSEDQLRFSSVHLPSTGKTPLTRQGKKQPPYPWECFTGHDPSVYGPNSIIISHQWDHKIVSSYSAFLLKAPDILNSDQRPIAFIWIIRTQIDVQAGIHMGLFKVGHSLFALLFSEKHCPEKMNFLVYFITHV
jgi:hypothetical protein